MTDRPFTTGLYMLRIVQLGIAVRDLELLEFGMVMDMMTEAANDSCEYDEIATQEDMDRF